ncbi:hypothetical protein vBEliSR6L_23 [Erythrobacter phage vB_EliS_R6L]|nr:hypothetical protein vBEliSR6L_23 [Erythrobacter phage vB_EliS_R6L]
MGRYSDDRGPARRGYSPPAKEAKFVPWKPDVCEEPGCQNRHPSFSKDGMAGPWRCGPCDKLASPRPPDQPFAEPAPSPSEPPASPQGRLI